MPDDVLLYDERGTMVLEGIPQPMLCYRKYCFNASVWPVAVLFVDDPTKKHLMPVVPGLDVHTSLFHELDLTTGSARFTHNCVHDIYSGEFIITSPASFEWNWTIKGPRKDGEITAKYRKLPFVATGHTVAPALPPGSSSSSSM